MNDAKPGKASRKRESAELQALGEALIGLDDAELRSVVADERLLLAVLDARSIRSRGASRRQRQLIGKIMRKLDAAPIREGLDRLRTRADADKALFRRAEAWRDRLCEGGDDALAEFARLTGGETAALGELLHACARAEHDRARTPLRRRIFREVHAKLAKVQNGER
ncbi:MAG: ribosome biogenesis factor YjgA [Woeseiaceae bacterium]